MTANIIAPKTYRIVRFFFTGRGNGNTIRATGLTLEEAQAHCQDPETSSETATDGPAGQWFDGYNEE